MVASAISGALTSLNLGAQAANSMLTLKVGSEVQAKAIELNTQIIAAQGHIMAIQSDYASAIKQVEALKEEITRMKAWGTESERYELKQVFVGSLAYCLKEDEQSGEPPHWLCVECFENKKKSFLQRKTSQSMRDHEYHCSSCSNLINVFCSVAPDSPWGGRPT